MKCGVHYVFLGVLPGAMVDAEVQLISCGRRRIVRGVI